MKMSFLSNIIGRHFEDTLIHDSVHADRDKLYRARILVFMMLMAIPTLVFLTGAMILWAPADLLALFVPINVSPIITMGVVAYILKSRGHVGLCCFLAVAITLTAAGFIIAITGGPYDSPVRQLLFLPCLMSFLFGGIRLGAATMGICLIMLVGMLTAQISGYEFPPIADAAFLESGYTTVLVINFLIIAVIAFSYEYTSITLKRERDEEYQKFIDLAHKDPLTGLSNRRIFDDALHSRIELYERMPSKPCFVLCYLDLDKFKPINDTYGHDVGDEVLSAVSNRLLSAQRGADFIGRHGGDEFMMLFDGVESTESMNALANRLLQLIRKPISTKAGMLNVDGSIGLAAYPTHGRDATALKADADAAMYEAKRAQTGFHVYQT